MYENVISTIKLDLSDCCSLAQIIKISDDGVPSLYCPYKSGYKFKNWADGNNNDVEIVDLRTFKDNVELKPVFEKVDESNNDNENNKDDENGTKQIMERGLACQDEFFDSIIEDYLDDYIEE